MLPTAMFFDLDDTIISFNGIAMPLWKELSEAYCRRTGHFQGQQLFETIRNTARWYWGDKERHREGRLDIANARRQIVKQAFRELGSDDERAAYALADEFSTKRVERITMFPGAKETLEALKQRGIRLALMTNGDAVGQNAKIDRFQLRPYFEHVFVEGEVGFGKPDPRVYRLALQTMQVSPQEVWMIGDNLEWDVGTPQKFGIYGIWNDYRDRGLPESSDVVPDRIISSIRELVE
jgi:putative hydrolase of the HAD superfamily